MRRFVRRTSRLAIAAAAMALLGISATAQPQPLSLRNGATPTGLWGYYDYQSNGMSPGWLYVEKNNPQRIHAVYMLSLDGTDTNTINTSRRVGYSYSTDGGQTWSATREIETGMRLGFPYLQVSSDGLPLIAAHGDPNNQGVQTLFYIGSPNSTELFRANEFPRATSSGRTGEAGAGVIWPAFVINPDPANPFQGIFIGSLSNATSEGPAPLQWTKAELGVSAPWSPFNGDSSVTATSGGRYVIATSPGGKVGIAWHTFGPADTRGIYFSESSDGGATFSAPMKAIGVEALSDTDTLFVSQQLDLAYRGEEAHIVVSGSLNNLFLSQQIRHWSAGSGSNVVVQADSTKGLGMINYIPAKGQANLSFIDYPTISIGDDGKHIAVAFMAASQTQRIDAATTDPGNAVASDSGFYYFRLWGVGSPDGGKSWGSPFILQDFAGDETDSASIEYPSANEVGRMVGNDFELSMAFQARRYPGMFTFLTSWQDNAGVIHATDRGPINPLFQYFQRTMLGPDKFAVQQASVGGSKTAEAGLTFSRSFPNPASAQLTVEYTLPTSGDVTLTLYNTLGDRVLTPVVAERGYAGTYTKTLDLSALPSGPYRLVLTQNGTSISQPVKIVR